MRLNLAPGQTDIGADDDQVAWLTKMGCGSIDANHARTAWSFDCVSGKPVSVGNVINLDPLMDQNAGSIQKIAIYGDGTFIIKVCFGHRCAVEFCF